MTRKRERGEEELIKPLTISFERKLLRARARPLNADYGRGGGCRSDGGKGRRRREGSFVFFKTRNLGCYVTEISSSCGVLMALGHTLVAFGYQSGALQAP